MNMLHVKNVIVPYKQQVKFTGTHELKERVLVIIIMVSMARNRKLYSEASKSYIV